MVKVMARDSPMYLRIINPIAVSAIYRSSLIFIITLQIVNQHQNSYTLQLRFSSRSVLKELKSPIPTFCAISYNLKMFSSGLRFGYINNTLIIESPF